MKYGLESMLAILESKNSVREILVTNIQTHF